MEPGAETVIVPLYVPAAREDMLAEMVKVAGVDPELGEASSQDAFDEAVQFRVPEPSLYTEIVWLGGLAAPCMVAKETDEGLTRSAGGAPGMEEEGT